MTDDKTTGVDPAWEDGGGRGDLLQTVETMKIPCKECGHLFEAKHGNTRYCSRRCAARARSDRRRLPEEDKLKPGPQGPQSKTGRIFAMFNGLKAGDEIYVDIPSKTAAAYKTKGLIQRDVKIKTVLVIEDYTSKQPRIRKIIKMQCIS